MIVNVGGQDWEVSTVESSYSSLSSMLVVQPWWLGGSDYSVADQFAQVVDMSLGRGVNYGYTDENDSFITARVMASSGLVYLNAVQKSEVVTWAVASPVPIPAAAWLFGSALLGLGVVKRKQLKA